MQQRRSNVEQLRRDIDSGRTRDKVRGGDPAAAPLGTDEEAAGSPVPPAAVSRARETELSRGAVQEHLAARGRARHANWTIAAFIGLAALGALAIWLAP